jgi:formylglycine-generating enzyme required for sulfatase activity
MKIFISYKREDEAFARRLYDRIKDWGYSPWLDVLHIPHGTTSDSKGWDDAIFAGMKAADIVIGIMTPKSLKSANVLDEWDYALRNQQRFYILWLYDVPEADIPPRYGRIQRIDMRHDENTGIIALQSAFASLQNATHQSEHLPVEIRNKPSSASLEMPAIPAPNLSNTLPSPFDWCSIPSGAVKVSSGSWEDGYYWEGSSRRIDVSGFYMAKYPITNLQYQLFVDAKDGYREARWWDYSRDAKAMWVKNPQPVKSIFAGDDCPRTNVNWYEAMAFCNWLNAQAKLDVSKRESNTKYLHITLPTEGQWQRAAQGNDRRNYPWGNTFDQSRCNTKECRIGRTTSVMRYPDGASPYGVTDLFGNVWEWCFAEGERSYFAGIRLGIFGELWPIRGGSWRTEAAQGILNYDASRGPNHRGDEQGFRIAAVVKE